MSKKIKTTFWTLIGLVSLTAAFWTYSNEFSHKTPFKLNLNIVKKDKQESIKGLEISDNTEASPTSNNPSQPLKNTPPLSYGDAVNKYNNSRIQFNDDCQGIPGQVFFANGTTVMLDNRANVKRKFSVAAGIYYVPAYGYTLIPLKKKKLPFTINVACNDHGNAVEIILE